MTYFSFDDIKDKMYDGQSVTVHIAHRFDYGSWKGYTTHTYNVYQLSESAILMQDADHPDTHLAINKKIFNNDGYIKIDIE